MIRVKVCGMRDPENIREVSVTGPDYMGFIFYPASKRYVGDSPSTLCEIVPQNIKKTGVFVNENLLSIATRTEKYGLEVIQLHGDETPELCSRIRDLGLIVIKSFPVSESFIFESCVPYQETCDYFLFDKKSYLPGGSGQKFDWDIIKGYDLETPFFLSGGIDINDVEKINSLNNNKLYAIDINSRFEISPGIKDVTKVKDFMAKLRH
jgi:phosphoribosylanthranilate isomerase